MKKMRFLFLILIISNGHIGCRSKTENLVELDKSTLDLKYYMVDLSEILNTKELVRLSKIAEDINYIPLETNPDSYLGIINKIIVTKSGIFISDSRRLLKFSLDGDFIGIIGGIGRGPGEYTSVADFGIDEKNSIIYISDPNKHGILKYDENGYYLDEIFHSFRGSQFVLINSDRIGIYTTEFSMKVDSIISCLIITDLEFNPINYFPSYHQQSGVWSIGQAPLYIHKDKLYYKENFNDTLYYYTESHLEAYAVLKLGDSQLPYKLSISNSPGIDELIKAMEKVEDKLRVHKIMESERFIFIQLLYGARGNLENALQAYYDKKNDCAKILDGKGFISDTSQVFTFWPKFIYDDSIYVDFISAYDFKSSLHEIEIQEQSNPNSKISDDLIILKDQINESDNPIILFAKMKDQ